MQDVTCAHKVDGEDSRDWTQRDFKQPKFRSTLFSHLPLCVCVCSVFVFVCFMFYMYMCMFCTCGCMVRMLHVYAYVIFTLPTTWLIFRFEYNTARASISPFSERNRGVTGMGTYLMKVLTQTLFFTSFVIIYCYENTFI